MTIRTTHGRWFGEFVVTPSRSSWTFTRCLCVLTSFPSSSVSPDSTPTPERQSIGLQDRTSIYRVVDPTRRNGDVKTDQ